MSRNDYVLTRHAKRRMRERDISIEQLMSVIEDPDYIDKGDRGEIYAEKIFLSGKNIKVIYVMEKGKKIIITAIRNKK